MRATGRKAIVFRVAVDELKSAWRRHAGQNDKLGLGVSFVSKHDEATDAAEGYRRKTNADDIRLDEKDAEISAIVQGVCVDRFGGIPRRDLLRGGKKALRRLVDTATDFQNCFCAEPSQVATAAAFQAKARDCRPRMRG